jgi:ABC-type uncharacterized transport system permease subunit
MTTVCNKSLENALKFKYVETALTNIKEIYDIRRKETLVNIRFNFSFCFIPINFKNSEGHNIQNGIFTFVCFCCEM